jgi:hypothetical protein
MSRRILRVMFVPALVLIFASSVWAQTNQKNIAFMGTASFSTTSGDASYTNFNLSPRGYYFIMDQVAVGGRIAFDITSSGGETATNVLFGPDGLYFFKVDMDKMLPFAGAGLFLDHYSNGESSTGVTFAIHGGMAYLLREHLALFPELELAISSRKSNTTTKISLGIGLAGFLY